MIMIVSANIIQLGLDFIFETLELRHVINLEVIVYEISNLTMNSLRFQMIQSGSYFKMIQFSTIRNS